MKLEVGDIVFEQTSTSTYYIYKVVRTTKTLAFIQTYDIISKKFIGSKPRKYRRDGSSFDTGWHAYGVSLLDDKTKEDYLRNRFENTIINLLKKNKYPNERLKEIIFKLKEHQFN
jgi:hypothetical protein